jgi:predicted ATP-dependent protease
MSDKMEFKTTEEIKVPKLLIDQVIGQEAGVDLIKKLQNKEEMFC